VRKLSGLTSTCLLPSAMCAVFYGITQSTFLFD
jgi:hypothetical protein